MFTDVILLDIQRGKDLPLFNMEECLLKLLEAKLVCLATEKLLLTFNNIINWEPFLDVFEIEGEHTITGFQDRKNTGLWVLEYLDVVE